MATLRTVTVKPSGGDYTSLSNAEAGEQSIGEPTSGSTNAGNLPAMDRQLDIACYAMEDTAAVTINGWTTDATRYIRVYTPSAERHAGVWSTTKYRLSVAAGAANYAITVIEGYTRLEGLQIAQTQTSARNAIFSNATSVLLDAILAWTASTSTTASRASVVYAVGGSVVLRNCAIYGSPQEDGVYVAAGATVDADNCTFAGNADYGVNNGLGGTVTLRNCYSGGNGTDDYNGTMTLTTCAHSSATVFTGSTASIAHTTANFTNVTAGSEDYHLVVGASATLLTGGTDLSATFTTDIDGETRVDWGIGADEYIAAAPSGQPTFKRFGGVCFVAINRGVW